MHVIAGWPVPVIIRSSSYSEFCTCPQTTLCWHLDGLLQLGAGQGRVRAGLEVSKMEVFVAILDLIIPVV